MLSEMTTLGLGGLAQVAAPDSETEVLAVLRDNAKRGERVRILGGGSNVIAQDGPCPGVVLQLQHALNQQSIERDGHDVHVTLGAGVCWDDWVAAAVDLGLSGHECLAGIPGLVGATPIQNVGAYGAEVSATVVRVRCYDRLHDLEVTLDNRACEFDYRSSVFKRNPERFVVLDVTFTLRADLQSVPLRFGELCTRLGVAGEASAPLHLVREAVLALRAGKGMRLVAGDPDSHSAGSFFTNPLVSVAAAAGLRLQHPHAAIPQFAAANGTVKLAAAWLLEHAGFPKGTRRGRVGTSSKHALALVNLGGATTAELLAYAGEIEVAVLAKYGVQLEREPVVF